MEIKTLEEVKRDHIIDTLTKLEWKIIRTARLLNIDRKTLYRYMQMYGIKVPATVHATGGRATQRFLKKNENLVETIRSMGPIL